MAKVTSTHIVATAPTGSSLPDSITLGGGSLWVEYGDGASSTGGGTSTIVQYTGLNTHDLYANIASKNEPAQIDPSTGKVTPILTGLCDPHGLTFVPSAVPMHGQINMLHA